MFSTRPCKLQLVGTGEYVSVKRAQTDSFLMKKNDMVVRGQLDMLTMRNFEAFTIQPAGMFWQLRPFVLPPVGFTGDASYIVQPKLAIGDAGDGRATLLDETAAGTSLRLVRSGGCGEVSFLFEDGRMLCYNGATGSYVLGGGGDACFKVYEMTSPDNFTLLTFALSGGCPGDSLIPVTTTTAAAYEQLKRDERNLDVNCVLKSDPIQSGSGCDPVCLAGEECVNARCKLHCDASTLCPPGQSCGTDSFCSVTTQPPVTLPCNPACLVGEECVDGQCKVGCSASNPCPVGKTCGADKYCTDDSKPVPVNSPTTSKKESNWLMWALIIGGGIVLLLVGLAALLIRANAKKKDEKYHANKVQDAEKQHMEMKNDALEYNIYLRQYEKEQARKSEFARIDREPIPPPMVFDTSAAQLPGALRRLPPVHDPLRARRTPPKA